MNVGELYQFLNTRIPPELSLDWDNDGFCCCPDKNAPVRRVLVSLDPTEAVVDLAIREGFDVILTHHPLLFKGVKAVNENAGVPRKLIKLIRAGVSSMAFHTRLDALDGGVNDVLCDLLGIRDAVPFGTDGETIGRVGVLDAPVTAEEFGRTVKEKLGAPFVLVSDAKRPVSRVAVLGGEGGDDIAAALLAGADTYVSGRLGYHSMTDAPETGINLIEAGHFYTEYPVCAKLEALVREADAAIDVKTVDSCRLQAL